MTLGTRQESSPRPKRILVVEDNKLNMRLVTDLLSARGFDLLTAEDGCAAVRIAHDNTPDLILLDIQLPDMSGLEVTRQLKADPRTQAIPIVAVTAFAMSGDHERMIEGGCDGYLAKPITVRSFVSTIETYL